REAGAADGHAQGAEEIAAVNCGRVVHSGVLLRDAVAARVCASEYAPPYPLSPHPITEFFPWARPPRPPKTRVAAALCRPHGSPSAHSRCRALAPENWEATRAGGPALPRQGCLTPPAYDLGIRLFSQQMVPQVPSDHLETRQISVLLQ